MTRPLAAAGALALLAGCASTPPAPPQRIEVPIAVPCRAPEVRPPLWAVDGLPIGADILQQTRALRAERQQRIAYQAEIEAALAQCR